ncbi:MAG: SPOR domain-containing protein, partial [Burkholderiales bacterium]
HKEAPAAPSAAERARAEAALAGIEYVVPVAALADLERVKELTSRLAAAKLPYYTERVATEKGRVTRVRAGPFASREAAEKAYAKLKGLGLKPGNVTTKS